MKNFILSLAHDVLIAGSLLALMSPPFIALQIAHAFFDFPLCGHEAHRGHEENKWVREGLL